MVYLNQWASIGCKQEVAALIQAFSENGIAARESGTQKEKQHRPHEACAWARNETFDKVGRHWYGCGSLGFLAERFSRPNCERGTLNSKKAVMSGSERRLVRPLLI